ncbi:unnamed protein product [Tetraodon nigroviridis]|uniref:Chromosome 18 SCAF15038, whole genome shotgun sequence n=1 Tax=Tetraodon nigroviridis TaxID=99883 RepID=Q4RJA8_TETNG|nr:unnamed protein product [Tetraodon nigroviridis]
MKDRKRTPISHKVIEKRRRDRINRELLAEFANYFHYGYHECMKNLVHYLTTEDRAETKDIKYARILAFLQSKSRVVTEPVFGPVGAMPEPSDYLSQLHSSPEHQSHNPSDSVFQQSAPGHFSWHSSARSPGITYPGMPLSAHTQQHASSRGQRWASERGPWGSKAAAQRISRHPQGNITQVAFEQKSWILLMIW